MVQTRMQAPLQLTSDKLGAAVPVTTLVREKEQKAPIVMDKCSVGEQCENSDQEYGGMSQPVDLTTSCEPDITPPGYVGQSSSTSCQTTFDTFMTNVKKNKESPGNKLLKCGDCDIVFPNRIELKAHMVQAHSRNEFKCKYCGKGFLTITGLQSHMPLHDGQWKLTCHLCGKGFQRRLDFEGHMNKHNNIKFICPNCEGSFYHKANWLKHQSRCGK